jgi:predicted DNA-binding WGR domain protein
MITRSFELTDGNSDKFWMITVAGKRHTVTFGRRGTSGQTQTKEFEDGDAAKRASEKLVAEKLKKGYVEIASSKTAPAKVEPAPPSSSPAKVTDRPAKAPQPTPIANPARQPLHLEPADWLIATWRPHTPEPKPPALPFDRQAAIGTINDWIEKYGRSHWRWRGWSIAELPASMSKEEARFWLNAIPLMMRHLYGEDPATGGSNGNWRKLKKTDADCAKLAEQFDYRKDLTLNAATDLLRHSRLTSLLLVPLLNLFPSKDAIQALVEISESAWSDFGDNCFQDKVIRYLSDEDCRFFRAIVQRKLAAQTWPSDAYEHPAFIFRLAALLGGGKELTRVVAAWPDDAYPETWSDTYHRPQEILFGLPEAKLVSHHLRRLKLRLKAPLHIRAWLAHTELAELDVITDSIAAETNRDDANTLAEAFCGLVAGPEAAPAILTLMVNSKAPRPARQWFMDHPAETIAGLAPMLAGKGKMSDAAADILRDLHCAGHAEALAAHLGADALARVQPKDAADTPLLSTATTPPGLAAAFAEAAAIKAKLPPWVSPDVLPAIVTASGRLTMDQLEAVLRTLAKSDVAMPHPLLLALRCYATAASLDGFSWTLFQRWLTEGAPAKEKWALSGVGIFGGDESAMRLAALVREWPGVGKHQTAVLGLECLRSIGTDTALQLISGIAQKVKFQAIKVRAQECMDAIAADLHLTRQQLEDRVVPDCGLDERGSRTFDFGPRQFRLVMSPELKPLLVDSENHRKPDLPKPNSKDDAEKAKEAIAAWKLVKKQVADVAKIQAWRLEQALVTQRRWTAEEFDRYLMRHPLMSNLVHSLVWGTFGEKGELNSTFRVTEDRSLADEHDAPVSLPADAAIGLVHPIQLTSQTLAAWGELISDYEMIPPFPQLGRPVLKLSAAELSKDVIERHTGASIPAPALVGTLEKLGWRRSTPADAGGYDNHGKEFAEAGVTAIIQYEPLYVGTSLAELDPVPINACYFVVGGYDRETWRNDEGKRIVLSKIGPLILSEVLSDLQAVASKGEK